MKKEMIIFQLMLVLGLQQVLHAKSYMPSLERLRNKVDDVMQSGGVTSLKTVLERAKLQGFNPGQGGTMVLSAQGVVGKNESDAACTLQQIHDQLQELVWASDTRLVTQLQTLTDDHQKEAIAKVVLERFADSPLPLIDFIVQLHHECNVLEQAKPDCTKLLLTRSAQRAKDFHEHAREILQKIKELNHNLEVVMKIVNSLLVTEV